MLNKNFAATSAMIGKAPKMVIEQPHFTKQEDWGQVMSKFLTDYKNQTNENELKSALQSGDEEAINKAAAAYDPKGFYDAMQKIKASREASDLDFERQKELLGLRNQYDTEAAEKRAALAEKIASIKAGGNGLVNINMNNPFDKKRIETIAKNMDENISTAQGVYDTYKQALDLLNAEDVKTGGAWNAARGASGKLAGSALLNSNEQRLNALINETIPKMRPVGSGSASDKDMETFAKATLGFGNTKDANKNIASGRMLAAENSMAMEELRAEYVTSGMGSVSDFDREWRKYLSANPIFNDKGGLNKSRVDAYSWFGGNQNALETVATPIPATKIPTDNDAFGDI
jgi:chorismate mutase